LSAILALKNSTASPLITFKLFSCLICALDFAKIFGNTHDVVLEIGFGNGDTLVEMAQANPALNYVGIEVYEAGIGRLINSAHIKQLNNLKSVSPLPKPISNTTSWVLPKILAKSNTPCASIA
jgi:tRNA G46 methylase TrmB